MICFVNRSTVDYDVRLKKYVKACINTGTSYSVIGWDRLLNVQVEDPNEILYRKYAPYGNGMKSLIPLIGWVFFVWYHLIKNWKNYKIIHACNMENTLIVIPFRLLGKKIVFDVYDSQKVAIEKKLVKHVSALILPHEKRLEQIGVSGNIPKRLFIIENVPTFNTSVAETSNDDKKHISLSYVGVMQQRIRGIENLIEMVVNDDRFSLEIAGVGDNMEVLIHNAVLKCDRIKYFGKVQYQQALEIMSRSQFIVALYYLCESSHKYASPNKYYESLFLGRPIITSSGTLVGDSVLNNNTGYVVKDTLEDLQRVFEYYGTDEFYESYELKSNNCKLLWEKSYKNYGKEFIEDKYIKNLSTI